MKPKPMALNPYFPPQTSELIHPRQTLKSLPADSVPAACLATAFFATTIALAAITKASVASWHALHQVPVRVDSAIALAISCCFLGCLSWCFSSPQNRFGARDESDRWLQGGSLIIAAIALLVRLLVEPLGVWAPDWTNCTLTGAAVLAMLLGAKDLRKK